MPDFLSRLIGRARGDAPMLERRSAQPFEAVQPAITRELQPGGEFGAESDATDERRAARETGASDATLVLSGGKAKRSIDAAASADSTAAAASRENRARPSTDDEHTDRETGRASPRDHDVEPRAAPKKHEALHASDIIAAVARRVDRKGEEPPRSGDEIGARVRRRDSEAPGDGASSAGKTRSLPARAPASAARAPKDANTDTAAPFAPITSRILPPQPAAKAASAPTIHVSIGRIEVRALAVAAPPQPRSAGKAAPRLTLDAYLRLRRTGGA